jgi:hypothetical protein
MRFVFHPLLSLEAVQKECISVQRGGRKREWLVEANIEQ